LSRVRLALQRVPYSPQLAWFLLVSAKDAVGQAQRAANRLRQLMDPAEDSDTAGNGRVKKHRSGRLAPAGPVRERGFFQILLNSLLVRLDQGLREELANLRGACAKSFCGVTSSDRPLLQ